MSTTTSSAAPTNASTVSARLLTGEISLRVRPSEGTAAASRSSVEGTASSYCESDFEVVSPVPIPCAANAVAVDSKPIQIWEGVVLALDAPLSVMHVRLNAKIGKIPEHTATVDLEWVHEQDRELMKVGAVFYLTVFRKLSRGSVQNSQEIRFRRLPSWSNADVRRLHSAADALASTMIVPNAPEPH